MEEKRDFYQLEKPIVALKERIDEIQESDDPDKKQKIEELKKKQNHGYQTLEEVKAGINKLAGAIEVTAYYLNNHINPEE